MLADTIDRGSVEKLVRGFYAKVVKDDLIARYFLIALGDDMKNDKWYEHLKLLDNFWYSLMTGEGRYRGDPFTPHIFLGGLTPEMFDRWVALFRETAEEVFTPPLALRFYGKAKGLAKRFMTDLEIAYEDE
jgi:hemoglobin